MRSPEESVSGSAPATDLVLRTLSLSPEFVESRFEFKHFREGVEAAFLYGEAGSGSAAAFLRYAPGAKVPRHRHRGHEHVFVLRGWQSDEKGRYDTGTLVVNVPGTEHEVSSPEGCLVFVIWERRVEFVG